jgi:hypothetical protein
MTGRRWILLAIACTLGAAVVGSGFFWLLKPGKPVGQAQVIPKKSPMILMAEGLRRGDTQALKTLCEQVLARADQPKTPVTEAEGKELVEVLDGLRAGFLKYNPAGRASAVSASSYIIDRFSVEPTPGSWFLALRPLHHLVIAGLADPHVDVRASTLTELGRHWGWLPGRSLTTMEEEELAAWKDAFYEPVLKRLNDPEPKSRAAAVVCIGALPINSMAEPALARLEDPDNGGVRYKTLMTFANRPALLTVDMILKRLHDPEIGIPELAEVILKGRGLTKEQIFLGRQITNPHPDVRVSVIPLIRDRTDIDPEVWLLQLSHDPEETVRVKAVEALLGSISPDVVRRLSEIAQGDTSSTIRAIASKHVAKTAALPPLPGSPSLNPKAN